MTRAFQRIARRILSLTPFHAGARVQSTITSEMFEQLEARQMLAFAAMVNFQPFDAAVPSGYMKDSGAVYANRGNGYAYGWSRNAAAGMVDRNLVSDQRYDTLAHMQAYGSRTWNMAVPNGDYDVRIVAGDPAAINSIYKIKAENTLVINATPTGPRKFIDNTVRVRVTDGRLTIANAKGAKNNKINFVEVRQVLATPAPTAPSGLAAAAASGTQIDLTWVDNNANEAGFHVERSADGMNFAQIAILAANATAFSVTGLAEGSTSFYRVRAFNSGGNSAYSNIASGTTLVTAPSTAGTLYVSTTGSDSNAGSATQPLRTIAMAASLAQPGETVLIRNGTYNERLVMTRSGTAEKPIIFQAETPGAVIIDGAGQPEVLVAKGGTNLIFKGITIRHAANGPQNYQAAVRTGDGWRMEDVIVEKVDGTAISAMGSNVVLLRVTAQDNGVAGIGSDGAVNLLIKDSISRRNNRGMVDPIWKNQTSIGGWPAARLVNGLWHMHPDFEAGGGKHWMSNGVTLDNVQVYDNIGPGIWFDWNNKNVTVRNSGVYGNRGLDQSYQGPGIRIELQKDGPALIENNILRDNTGGGLTIESSRNVTVRNNTLINGGLILRDHYYDADHTMLNVSITGNRFKDCWIDTWDGTWNATSGTTKQMTINSNVYDNGSRPLMMWGGQQYYTLSSIRTSLGFELNGSLGTVTG